MSFLNLTSLGYDNQFKSMKNFEPIDSNQLRKNSTEGSTKTSFEKQLTRELIGDFQSRQWSSPAISNLNYHSLHSMHVHGNQNPSHTVRRPLTESQQIGWWIKDTPLKINEPWTQKKHHVHAQSEMTKFVDTLMLTDRSFRLF